MCSRHTFFSRVVPHITKLYTRDWNESFRHVFRTSRRTSRKLRHHCRSRFSQPTGRFSSLASRVRAFPSTFGSQKASSRTEALSLHPFDESRSEAVLPSRARTFKLRVGPLKGRSSHLNLSLGDAGEPGREKTRSHARFYGKLGSELLKRRKEPHEKEQEDEWEKGRNGEWPDLMISGAAKSKAWKKRKMRIHKG